MFHKLLVPLDGSSIAEAAIPHAAAVAATFGSDVLLLRVIPVRQRSGAAPMDIIDRRLCHAEARAYLEAVATDLRAHNLTVETHACRGQPAEQIVEAAHKHDVDLVVLTTHGVGGCTEFPVSGTAQKVISRAPVSVFMVPTSEPAVHAPGTPEGAYRRVLVGLDGSRRGEWALGPAAALARYTGAELLLVHVVPVPETFEEPSTEPVAASMRKK
jgi:nucleotide-binding universal stress UspA family protein